MKKPDYYYKQSAVVPFRVVNKKVEILLITSRKKKRWIIPKGIIETELTAQESALKEAIEEAGVSGKVLQELFGKFEYKKWGDTCRVKVYIMEVKQVMDKWAEDFRDRKWVRVKEAIKEIDNAELKSMLEVLEDKLESLGYI